MPFPLLFVPDPGQLFGEISAMVDDSMLREIAEADYGAWSAENYAVLCRMRDERFIPAPDWVPKEVLELIRWSEPDDSHWRPGSPGRRGHLMRLFCCTSLLRMAGTQDFGLYIGFNETVAGLLVSLDALSIDLWSNAGSLLTWFLNRSAEIGDDGEDAFLGVAILLCALRSRQIADSSLVDLSAWIWEREKAAAALVGALDDERWLSRTSPHSLRWQAWQMLGEEWTKIDLSRHSSEVRHWVGSTLGALAGNRRSAYPA